MDFQSYWLHMVFANMLIWYPQMKRHMGTIFQVPHLASAPSQEYIHIALSNIPQTLWEHYGWVDNDRQPRYASLIGIITSSSQGRMEMGDVGHRGLSKGGSQICSWLLVFFSFQVSFEPHWLETRDDKASQLPPWALFKPWAQTSDRWGHNSLHTTTEGPVWVPSADFQADLNATLRWGLWDLRSLWKFPRTLNIPGLHVLPQPWPAWGIKLPENTQIIFPIVSFLHHFKQKSESPFSRWGNRAISCGSKTRPGFSGLPVSQNIISGTFWLPFNYSSSGFLSLHKFHSVLTLHPHA